MNRLDKIRNNKLKDETVKQKSKDEPISDDKFKIIPNEQTPKTPPILNVRKFIKNNSKELKEFLEFSSNIFGAAAVAANQVSVNGKRLTWRVFVKNDLTESKLIINPVIDEYIGTKEEKEEGCLSWKGKKIIAQRSPKIKVSYYTIDGKKISGEEYSGDDAQVWQHEVDHLNGVKMKIVEPSLLESVLYDKGGEIKVKTPRREYTLEVGDITANEAIEKVKEKYPNFKEFEYKTITYKKTGKKGEFIKRIDPPEKIEQRWQKKKDHIRELSDNVSRLKNRITRDLKGEDEKDCLSALIIAIMLKTGERIGNSASAKYKKRSKDDKRKKAFGVSVFLKKHATIVGNKIHLDYIGKKGVPQDKSFSDEKISKALKIAIKKSPTIFIFSTSEGQMVTDGMVNKYLKEFNISCKAVRGYSANKWTVDKLKTITPEDSNKKRKKQLGRVLKIVAEKVGHGPSVLKNQYLMPEVITYWVDKGEVFDIKEAGYVMEKGGQINQDKYNVSFHQGLHMYQWNFNRGDFDRVKNSDFDSSDNLVIKNEWLSDKQSAEKVVEEKEKWSFYKGRVYVSKQEMEKGGKTQLEIGIEVEKEHKDLYRRVKKMFEAEGKKMPITETEFYKTIAKAHIKEDKYYYDKLLKYVEGKEHGGNIRDKGELEFHKLYNNLFVVTSNTQEKLAKTFVRVNEYLDSEEFKGKIFTLDEVKEYFIKKQGAFTYYKDFKGFNIPDYVVDVFLSGKFDPLSEEEKWLMNNLKSNVGQKPYYVIGYVDAEGEEETRHHELAHALYYLNPKYKNEVNVVITDFWRKISPESLNKVKVFLKKFGYDISIFNDEMNAYLIADKPYLISQLVWHDDFEEYRKRLSSIFNKHYLQTFGQKFSELKKVGDNMKTGGTTPLTREQIIVRYNLTGKTPVPIRFKGDNKTYFTKNLSVDRKVIFVTDGSGKSHPKKIEDIVHINGRDVKFEKGGEIETIVTPDGSEGGIFKGDSHAESPVGGMPTIVTGTGQKILVEGDEALLVPKVSTLKQKVRLVGTPKSVLSKINEMGDGANFSEEEAHLEILEIKEKGGKMKKRIRHISGDVVTASAGAMVINKKNTQSNITVDCTGTPQGIASAINEIDNNGVKFGDGAKCKILNKNEKINKMETGNKKRMQREVPQKSRLNKPVMEKGGITEPNPTDVRTDDMVKSWKEKGIAYSNLGNDDNKFISEIDVTREELGITSQTGNDIVYYDTNIYKSGHNALRGIKGGSMEKGGVTMDKLNSFIAEINEAGGGKFYLSGAYGQQELWAKDYRHGVDGGDSRIEAGSKKDIYEALIKNRYNKKYNPNYADDKKETGGSVTSKQIYWTLPQVTPVHNIVGTNIVIEKQGEPIPDKTSYMFKKNTPIGSSQQLYRVYMESPDGQKYWITPSLSQDKARKRAQELKYTIESGYKVSEQVQRMYSKQ